MDTLLTIHPEEIRGNFATGICISQYVIGAFGARKGLVDIAVRTAEAGYLTRRLIEVGEDRITRSGECTSPNGVNVRNCDLNVFEGRFTANSIKREDGRIIERNTLLTRMLIKEIESLRKLKYINLEIRSPLTCRFRRFNSVCPLCYGLSPQELHIVNAGDYVGVIAAQSIGEPSTQASMRTKHTGGVVTKARKIARNNIASPPKKNTPRKYHHHALEEKTKSKSKSKSKKSFRRLEPNDRIRNTFMLGQKLYKNRIKSNLLGSDIRPEKYFSKKIISQLKRGQFMELVSPVNGWIHYNTENKANLIKVEGKFGFKLKDELELKITTMYSYVRIVLAKNTVIFVNSGCRIKKDQVLALSPKRYLDLITNKMEELQNVPYHR